MVPLTSLWLPILLSAVAVFIASFVIHMVLKYHKGDIAKAASEDAILDTLRGLAPGDYMLPYVGDPSALKNDPALKAKLDRGPMVQIRVMGEKMERAFPKALMLWFVYSIVVSVFAAYVAGRARGPGVEYLEVFRFTATTAFVGYALAMTQESIWFGRKWSTTMKYVFNGLIYALLTGGFFGWLWPKM